MKYSLIALAIVAGVQIALCKQPQGTYDQPSDSYRHETVKAWYDDWEKRFNELNGKIPDKVSSSPQQEYQRRTAKNYANNMKVNYNDKKDYYLSQTGFMPYTFMMNQESRLNYLGRTHMNYRWQTYKCGSGPYTSFYCGQLDEE